MKLVADRAEHLQSEHLQSKQTPPGFSVSTINGGKTRDNDDVSDPERCQLNRVQQEFSQGPAAW